jgi:hypothetical protein
MKSLRIFPGLLSQKSNLRNPASLTPLQALLSTALHKNHTHLSAP